MQLTFRKQDEKDSVLLSGTDGMTVFLDFPVIFHSQGRKKQKLRYNETKAENGVHTGVIRTEDEVGNQYEIVDRWTCSKTVVSLDRSVTCSRFVQPAAVRLTTEFRCCDGKAKSFDDYQFIIPGALYNKNDTDGDGKDDYLGTFSQDYKDDRNPSLSVTAYGSESHGFCALIRADVPQKDTTITREQIQKRHFIHDTDIGSLGIAPSEYKTDEFLLRCDYPFCERNSFCLNVDGSGWSAYKAVEKEETFKMSYLLQTGRAESLTEASWKTVSLQMARIMKKDIPLPFTLEEARYYRRKMVYDSYREFADKKGRPAGYFVHFSPRQGYGKHNLLEYGFTGAQTLLSLDMLAADEEEYRESARHTLDFFVRNCIEKSGIPNGIYNVDREEFVYWWTGILLPFQYSDDRKELEKYLGVQVAGSLMAVAKELGKVKGNYLRTMTDAMYYLFKSWKLEKERGYEHPEWIKAVHDFTGCLLRLQNENGSWNRAYSMEGEPLYNPPQWFGATEKERGCGAIFPVPLLLEMYGRTREDKYLQSAKRAGQYIIENYVKDVTYIGGINDTSHRKSVKMDGASVLFVMRSLLALYEACKEKEYLTAAEDAAKILASWVYLWDVPFDKTTLLGDHDFKTTGWAVCDVIPAGSYVDCSFLETVPELLRIAGYCKNQQLAMLAKIITRGMQHGLAMPQDMYGYSMAGVQCEGYMTSLWLADTEYSEFSGAAAKNKGDDNDTCNGFVNGMALLNLDSLAKTYGTLDFDKIV